jgi:hypothetical protein
MPDEVIGFSSRTMGMESIQPLTEMSKPACKADNLTAICEPIF